jgi:hypothetical protein
MERKERAETSANKIQVPGNQPKERIKDPNKISMGHQCLN